MAHGLVASSSCKLFCVSGLNVDLRGLRSGDSPLPSKIRTAFCSRTNHRHPDPHVQDEHPLLFSRRHDPSPLADNARLVLRKNHIGTCVLKPVPHLSMCETRFAGPRSVRQLSVNLHSFLISFPPAHVHVSLLVLRRVSLPTGRALDSTAVDNSIFSDSVAFVRLIEHISRFCRLVIFPLEQFSRMLSA